MKKLLSFLLFLSVSVSLFAAGSNFFTKMKKQSNENRVIRIMTINDEIESLLKPFLQNNPDFGYQIEYTVVPSYDDSFLTRLDSVYGTSESPDLLVSPDEFSLDLIKGSRQRYCLPVEELGIDVQDLSSKVAPYTIDTGTNTEGKLVGLTYRTTTGAFIYRRSIAQAVFGTDDPKKIEKIIGGGTGKWDDFLNAAEKLQENDYTIVSSLEDVWRPYSFNAKTGWLKDGKFYLDPVYRKFLSFAKILEENGYVGNSCQWQDSWFDDMRRKNYGAECFGFFGPAWFLNYVIAPNTRGISWYDNYDSTSSTYGDWAICEPPVNFFWGITTVQVMATLDDSKKEAVKAILEYLAVDESKNGVQQGINGSTLEEIPDTVPLKSVMRKNKANIECLDGQDMNEIFAKTNEKARGLHITQYDFDFNSSWLSAVRDYLNYGDEDKIVRSFCERYAQ